MFFRFLSHLSMFLYFLQSFWQVSPFSRKSSFFSWILIFLVNPSFSRIACFIASMPFSIHVLSLLFSAFFVIWFFMLLSYVTFEAFWLTSIELHPPTMHLTFPVFLPPPPSFHHSLPHSLLYRNLPTFP